MFAALFFTEPLTLTQGNLAKELPAAPGPPYIDKPGSTNSNHFEHITNWGSRISLGAYSPACPSSLPSALVWSIQLALLAPLCPGLLTVYWKFDSPRFFRRGSTEFIAYLQALGSTLV